MERATETTAAQALSAARRFLSRWRDERTRSLADDLAQEAAVEAWLGRATLRETNRWEAFVRTICRRCRYRALSRSVRLPQQSLDADEDLLDGVAREPARRHFVVGGRSVSLEWCLRELDGVMAVLAPLNRRIVNSYYEGFSCRELAERYGLSEHSVKVRLYRSRLRIRREFELRAKSVEPGPEELFG